MSAESSKVAIVTYKIKDGRGGENIKYISNVFAKLKENCPEGVKYASVVSDDKLTFTHIAFFDSKDMGQALTGLEEFKAFQKELKDRCEILPQANFCEIIGSYNMFL